MSIQLKIKIKTLAVEARFIRTEELKARKMSRANAAYQDANVAKAASSLRANLWEHRINVVRPEARSSQLAYGFLRGKKYSEIEGSVRPDNKPDLKAIKGMVERFGENDKTSKIKDWLEA